MGLLLLRRVRVGGRREVLFRLTVVARVDHRMRLDDELKKAQLPTEYFHRRLSPRAVSRMSI